MFHSLWLRSANNDNNANNVNSNGNNNNNNVNNTGGLFNNLFIFNPCYP